MKTKIAILQLCFFILLFGTLPVHADIVLPSVLGNNMVLQQNQQVSEVARGKSDFKNDEVLAIMQKHNMSAEDAFSFYQAKNGNLDPGKAAEELLESRRAASTLKPGGSPRGGSKIIYVTNSREKFMAQTLANYEGKNIEVKIKKDD